jgi:tRNA pseudouridine38/39 synthase
MNHCLPKDIKMIGCTQVPLHFDSRFSCLWRDYKYFFCRGDLDITIMKKAAAYFIGIHDFRNFCKRDEAKNPEYVLEYEDENPNSELFYM